MLGDPALETRKPKAMVRTLVTNDSLMRLVMMELLPTPSALSVYALREGYPPSPTRTMRTRSRRGIAIGSEASLVLPLRSGAGGGGGWMCRKSCRLDETRG